MLGKEEEQQYGQNGKGMENELPFMKRPWFKRLMKMLLNFMKRRIAGCKRQAGVIEGL